jgi:hypothetical protein
LAQRAGSATELPTSPQHSSGGGNGYARVLIETFVETARFTGASYKAANWIHVGTTKGRGKLDRYNEHALPVKDVYLYPLRRDDQRLLSSPTPPA